MRSIHITGASGSGTTTLGRALAERLGWVHLDSDDFFWVKTDPPFQTKREAQERTDLLLAALGKAPAWILSGSIMGWSRLEPPGFDLVIFLSLPSDIRMERLRAREEERYGAPALEPGGDRYRESIEFLDWAGAYEQAETVGRNRIAHERWLVEQTCPILRLDSMESVQHNVEAVVDRLDQPIDCS